jgi:hypothetical protein
MVVDRPVRIPAAGLRITDARSSLSRNGVSVDHRLPTTAPNRRIPNAS